MTKSTHLHVFQAAQDEVQRDGDKSAVRTYPWSERGNFQSMIISRGGSGDASAEFDDAGAADLSDAQRSLGRYPRNYTRGKERSGATIALYCFTRLGAQVRLTGIPFGTPTGVDLATGQGSVLDNKYDYLSKCGVRLNDMTPEEKAQADRVNSDWRDHLSAD
jgi:hypothetical protein